ncbi:uridine nucleosidase [Pleurotus eryngii]|uniref:Uridine nucleosidase n=1 Tax=Pleurotus eryngii TaxID=5323 RepID=A0A9P6A2C6_PLEER|nr:uridine nucleosidase [Pleurotus eryngii]
MDGQQKRFIWLDCDPGHDDATAIMLALHCPNITLLGISTTHGNTDSQSTAINAARCLYAFGAPSGLRVYPGASKPLLLPPRYDAEIHGEDGLGGVEGLPDTSDPALRNWFVNDDNGKPTRALEGMVHHIKATWQGGAGHKVCMVSSGPMTNVALFVSIYPDLVDAIEEFVFMGGGVGMGNRSPVAEWNILCDPHAAQIVLNTPVKKTMIPLNVTHTAIVTKTIRASLLDPSYNGDPETPPKAVSNLRHTLSTLLTFFADAYKATFGFNDGPPLHDAVTILYISQPELFNCTRFRVDVELIGEHTVGETVVDIWHYKPCDLTWGPKGRNCLVAQSVNASGLFKLLLESVVKCDRVSPLNTSQ